MDFKILGPLEVHGEGGPIDVPGRKPRAVLAVLLLHPNQPVSAERLAVALWGREAPAGAIRTVHVNVSRLRKALGGGDVLTTTPAGYRLRVEPGELDADRFEALVEDGRRAMASGQAEDAGRLLREALALWRGQPLGDLAFEPFAQVEIARLEEQHEAAIAARVEADLAAGRHEQLIAELRRLVADHPTHERLAGQLMLALYRSGRQADALDAYREARRRLADELGVEPGDELRALQDAILHQDPKLLIEPAGELPHELDASSAPPLVGRETEMAWLRERWQEARSGNGRLAALAGTRGMGRTRLAAELAGEVHASGGGVLYASGAWPARAVGEVLERARGARRPLLLVVDDADQASRELMKAVRDVAGGETLVLATATAHEALEGLEPGIVLFLDLDRLGPAAVAKIAALYVPDETADVLPAEWLLGASAGVPQRVHDVASQWARERVDTVAGNAAAERSRLRSMEDELAGGVAQLQAVREWAAPPRDGEHRIVCPFKGLASFEADDAPYFFGRERLVAELVARLVGAPLLAVVGPSGSGKSSVVRAGLLPALKSGVLPGSEQWPQILIRPGEHPLRSLDRALASAPADRFVLAVDQFEETFTACREEAERAAFISQLVGESAGTVVIALRADFYGRCAEYPVLSRLLASNHVLVGPMQPEELRRAVVCPAQRVGLSVEDELVDRIVEDVEDAPGALPLLSTALLELWQNRDGRRLRLGAYERTGGVQGAVARLAEEAYNQLDGEQRELARRVLLQLVEADDEGTIERRRVPLTDVGADAEPLLDTLADARLLTLSEGTVELAHEALLREWPRLAGWIEAGREDMRVERTLRAGAREWERVDREDGALFRGARLAETREWSERVVRPSGLEGEFLQASLQRERHDRVARRRRFAVGFGAVAVGLVAIAVFAAITIDQRRDRDRERDLTTSRELASDSAENLAAEPELAVRLALTAVDSSPTDEAVRALREATAAFRPLAVVRADSTDAWTAVVSPDAARMVTGGTDGNVILWDVETQSEASRWAAEHTAVASARYSADGEHIALGFDDGAVVVTDPSLGSRREIAGTGDSKVWSVALTADGTQVAAAFDDGVIRLFTVNGSEPPQLVGRHESQALSVDISADGTRVASSGADGTVRLWSPAGGDGRVLHREDGSKWDVAISPEGNRILAAGDDGVVRRFDARTGREGPSTEGGGNELYTVAFSPDGSRFAAGGEDGVIRVWTVPGGPPVVVLRGQGSRVYDVGFAGRSDRVVSAADDGTARLWDATGPRMWKVPGSALSMDYNRDGTRLATSSEDGVARIWDAASSRLEGQLAGPPGGMTARFGPTDTLALASESTPAVRSWAGPGESAKVVARASKTDGVLSARFDPSGERLVYADTDGRITVRTLASGEEVTLRGGPETMVYDAQFSADGERVASAPETGQVAIWRMDQPEHVERVLKGHRGHLNWLDYGADGRLLTASGDRTARVWPAEAGPAVIMGGFPREVTGAAFYGDGSKVVTTSFDGTLRLWDAGSGVLLAILDSGPAELHSVLVSSKGDIATLDENGVMRVGQCEVCGSLEEVRALALSRRPRQLTAEERRRFLPDEG
jgi:WD40 repeat protein/DNA-binding SARP family transcriptional activator